MTPEENLEAHSKNAFYILELEQKLLAAEREIEIWDKEAGGIQLNFVDRKEPVLMRDLIKERLAQRQEPAGEK